MKSPIIVALDFPTRTAFDSAVAALDPGLCRVKVGKEIFTRFGPAILEPLMDRGFDVFLDLKFHDIPNTVAGACRAAADLGVWMVNVHASGGRRMLEAARDAVASARQPPLLIAVSILTSLGDDELAEIGMAGPGAAAVERLARLAADCGVDGLVCSPREITQVRQATGAGFRLVTPGVRPAGADLQDQRRVMTPADALAAGSDYLVIGRPITQADNPRQALLTILETISDS